MRTSTGSISVMKIIQKKIMRPGKRKNTTAYAEIRLTEILPKVTTSATISELNSKVDAGGDR